MGLPFVVDLKVAQEDGDCRVGGGCRLETLVVIYFGTCRLR